MRSPEGEIPVFLVLTATNVSSWTYRNAEMYMPPPRGDARDEVNASERAEPLVCIYLR